jgi:uncharacterized membrane protein
MEERVSNLEEFARYVTDMIALMDEDQRRMAEAIRQMNEAIRQMNEAAERRSELLQRMAQAITIIQADIVRIDQTHT